MNKNGRTPSWVSTGATLYGLSEEPVVYATPRLSGVGNDVVAVESGDGKHNPFMRR